MNSAFRSRTAIAAAVAVIVVGIAAIAVWLLDSGSDKQAAPAHATSTTPAGVRPKIVTAATLRSIARALGRPVYWAGIRPSARLEYTEASDGSIYVRYLTGSARAGDKGSDYVVVATYAQPDALARVRSAARKRHFTLQRLPDGAVAVTDPTKPRNIHLVFGTQPYQVELYAPTANEAQRIVKAGMVGPVR